MHKEVYNGLVPKTEGDKAREKIKKEKQNEKDYFTYFGIDTYAWRCVDVHILLSLR